MSTEQPSTPEIDPTETRSLILRAQSEHGLPPDDVVAIMLPLLKQVKEAHERGLVAPLPRLKGIGVDDEGSFCFAESDASAPNRRLLASVIAGVQDAIRDQGVEILTESRDETDLAGNDVGPQEAELKAEERTTGVPEYLPGFISWENAKGQHDELTDIFCCGLLLASLAVGLDFEDATDVKKFTKTRDCLFNLNSHLHPVLAVLAVEMTELDRHKRAQDLPSLILRLENYREQPTDFDFTQLKGFKEESVQGKRKLVLHHLRDRLFELSKRNRLLYFKPGAQIVNLTVSSVPLRMDPKSIRRDHLFLWQGEIASSLPQQKSVTLNRYIRQEEAPYVFDQFEKLISQARRDRAEYGFEQLRLVICLLRWNNLKENPKERIVSPLLLLPVELKKKRGIRDSFHLRGISNIAEVNPALRYYLRELYDLKLPESIDLSETNVDEFHQWLEKQIKASEPGISLKKLDRPRVDIIHRKAKIQLNKYRKNRQRVAGPRIHANIDYSYNAADYRPLGLQIFLQKVRPSLAEAGSLLGDRVAARGPSFAVDPKANGGEGDLEVEKTFYSLREEDDGNPYHWSFDLSSLSLGNFNYRKMTLVHDYNELLDADIASPSFDSVFSLEAAPTDEPSAPLPMEEQYSVVPADPTQMSAVAKARDGKSFIIQGPPGTGKSQTITNLIADFVANGKRVLFVCEKRAAIDVVFHRLRQQGLSELCCLIHDSQNDKKSFVLDLKDTYNRFLEEDSQLAEREARRKEAGGKAEMLLNILRRFDEAMCSAPPDCDAPIHRILNRLVEIRASLAELSPEQEELLPPLSVWLESGHVVSELGELLHELGEDPAWGSNPLRWVNPEALKQDLPVDRLRKLLEQAQEALAETREQLGLIGMAETCATPAALQDVLKFVGDTEDLGNRALLSLLDAQSRDSRELTIAQERARKLVEKQEEARQAAGAWKEFLEEADAEIALQRAESFQGSALAWFKPSYWRLRKLINQSYDFDKNKIRRTEVQALKELKDFYDAKQAYADYCDEFRILYGSAEPDAFVQQIESLRTRLSESSESTRDIYRQLTTSQTASDMIAKLTGLANAHGRLEENLHAALLDTDELPWQQLEERLKEVQAELGLLPDLLSALLELAEAPEVLERANRRLPLRPTQLEAAICRKELHAFYRNNRQAARVDSTSLRNRSRKVAQLLAEQRDRNGELIVARVQERFRERINLSSLPVSQLGAQQKLFKKRYNAGRRTLEHEFGKSMRYKPIRSLAADESGMVVADLKPVWLMSPLSVSDTLPMDTQLFDVVIFDEASQIPLEEAVPTLYRGAQIIVVGDEMQLPPTKFFASSSVPGMEEDGEDSDEMFDTLGLDLESDSFLTQAAINLGSTMLGWHYRSRSEALIGFSNAAFYGGELLTIPDRGLPQDDLDRIEYELQDGDFDFSDAGEDGAEDLLDRSISFHLLHHSPYERRRNRGEANYIAELVRSLLAKETGRTIGIVAFSEAQQDEIEGALNALAKQDREFRDRLEAEYDREEDDQFCGLIVKNLENIQGDERDIIILSICYGPDRNGKMLMNFGPINQRGGEKRLNVIFSRAKQHMAVVSSIRFHDITNEYNDGANSLRQFLQYAESVSAGELSSARRVLESISVNARKSLAPEQEANAVIEQLDHALKERGWLTSRSVGQSKFRCDLAVHAEGDEHFRMAILVDGPGHYAHPDALDKHVLRQGVLRAFGWECLMVLTKDWFHDPESVLGRIERMLKGETLSEDAPEELATQSVPREDAPLQASAVPKDISKDIGEETEAEEPIHGVEVERSSPVMVMAMASDVEAVETEGDAADAEEMEAAAAGEPAPDNPATYAVPVEPELPKGECDYLECHLEGASKFWECHQAGAELTIRYGKIGAKGRTETKSFETEKKANTYRARQVRSKQRKGYRFAS